MNEAQRDVALFRYSLIREAADERAHHPPARRARARAGRPRPRRARTAGASASARGTHRSLDPRLSGRRLRGAGPDVAHRRAGDRASGCWTWPRRSKREVPRRTAAQVTQIIRTTEGTGPSERTLQRHFARLGLNTRPDGSAAAGLRSLRGRRARATCGPATPCTARSSPGARPTCSASSTTTRRALVGYRCGLSEDTVRLEAAFRAALAARGVPRACYLDNGSAMVSKQLLRACASLGIRLVHSRARASPRAAGKSSGSSRRCASSSSSRSRPGHRPTWPSSTGSSAPGSRPSITAASTPRPARPPIERLLAGGACGAADPSRAPRGLLVVRGPHGDQDGHGLAALEHL